MAFIHLDTDHTPGSGVQDSLPGTNVRFAADAGLGSRGHHQPPGPDPREQRDRAEGRQWKDKIVVPKITRASGRTLIAVVDAAALGGVPARAWGYQVLMQSNEGFPAKTDLLTRKVNEFEGQHRFGGGTDYDNDPQVIDIFAGAAKGEATRRRPARRARSTTRRRRSRSPKTSPCPDDLSGQ
jgi:hypothetical protein